MIETKEILDSLGLEKDFIKELTEGDKGIDDFKTHHQKDWIHRDLAKDDPDLKDQITGKTLGSISFEARKLFDLTPKDIEDKRVIEVIQMGVDKHKEKLQEIETQLEEAGNNPDLDKKIKDLNKKIEEKEEKLKENTEKIFELNTKAEETQTGFDEKLSRMKVDTILTSAKSDLNFKEGITPVEKAGLESLLSSNFTYKLDDKEELGVFDKEGNQIKNEKQTGNITLSEHLAFEAEKNGLLKLNNVDPERKNIQPPPPSGDEKPLREVAKHATQHTENMTSQ